MSRCRTHRHPERHRSRRHNAKHPQRWFISCWSTARRLSTHPIVLDSITCYLWPSQFLRISWILRPLAGISSIVFLLCFSDGESFCVACLTNLHHSRKFFIGEKAVWRIRVPNWKIYFKDYFLQITIGRSLDLNVGTLEIFQFG
nr:uncharacterized protein LOC127349190 isoform X1 [Lolium perenne]